MPTLNEIKTEILVWVKQTALNKGTKTNDFGMYRASGDSAQ